ncbi:MAG: DNA polymerase III subunit epsilon [Hyphomicrobiales bacterium]|nr:DNA polymerase III subunit epsilon [Hyphomicrobiales bacterium]
MREIVLDTETTGLDPASGDRVVEIGCVELLNHIPTGRDWHYYFNPEREMSQGAYEVHGLSTEFLSDKPLFKDLADDFLSFIEGAQLVIHNASFDVGFLNAELKRVGRKVITMDQVVDTLALARRKHPGAANSLDALCKRYQIDNSARTKHGALLDSELLAEVYVELTGKRQARLELAAEGAAAVAEGGGPVAIRPRPEPLPPRLSESETASHREFVATLGDDALWKGYLAKD